MGTLLVWRCATSSSLVQNRREIDSVLSHSEILVDGVARKEASFPVGLFNVITVPKEDMAFRLIPSSDGLAAKRSRRNSLT